MLVRVMSSSRIISAMVPGMETTIVRVMLAAPIVVVGQSAVVLVHLATHVMIEPWIVRHAVLVHVEVDSPVSINRQLLRRHP